MSVLSINVAKVAEDDRAVAYAYAVEFGADAGARGLLVMEKAAGECRRVIGQGDDHAAPFAAASAKLRRTVERTGLYPDGFQVVC